MKKILAFLGIISLVGLSFRPVINAEETEEEPTQDEVITDETIEEEVPEEEEIIEEVTFSDQIKDFLDEWFSPILTALTGATSAIAMLIVFAGKVKKLTLAIQENKEASDEERRKNEQELAEAKAQLEEAKEQAKQSALTLSEVLMESLCKIDEANNKTKDQLSTEVKASLLAMVEKSEELTSQLNVAKEDLNTLRNLLVLAISSNPTFAVSEHGQKMLTLLNDKEVI
jgi:hypothetical protein